MVDLDWHKSYETGIEFIDKDHKRLLSLMRKLQEAIINNDLDLCSHLSASMIEEARNHFLAEETFLRKAKYPDTEEHKLYHQEFLLQANLVMELGQGINNDHDLKESFHVMKKFLIEDIVNDDLKFLSFLGHKGHVKP